VTQMDLFPEPTPRKPSSLPVIPASRSATQVSASDRKMTATSGRTSCKLLHKNDRLSAFSKTFMVTSAWASTKCFLTWKVKGTPAGRLLFQLAVSMRPTEEIGSGLLPTPVAYDAKPGGPNNHYKGLGHQAKHGGKLWTDNETQKIGQPKMWPTPRSCTAMSAPNIQNRANDKNPNLETVVARSLWPTPTANEDAAGTPNGKMQRMLGNHPGIRGTTPEEWKAGSLNPAWVEWLMGYPSGWTDLED